MLCKGDVHGEGIWLVRDDLAVVCTLRNPPDINKVRKELCEQWCRGCCCYLCYIYVQQKIYPEPKNTHDGQVQQQPKGPQGFKSLGFLISSVRADKAFRMRGEREEFQTSHLPLSSTFGITMTWWTENFHRQNSYLSLTNPAFFSSVCSQTHEI